MGHVAIVTGGTRGIGEAISVALEGRRDTPSPPPTPATTEAAKRFSERTVPVSAPASSTYPTSMRAGMPWTGSPGISVRSEILVNNAGITRDGTMHRMSFHRWNAVLQTNLSSCFNMSRCVIDGMRERGFGRIVNIGSVNGQAGQYGQVNYAAAKSGIHGFTKALAQEGAGKGITVNAIAPGYIDTDMVRAVPEKVLAKIIATIPVGRLGHASEIAKGVLFLVDDDMGFMTGSTLSINGGQHMY